MNAPTRVAGFVLGLAAVFGTALAVGDRVGPVGAPAEAAMEHTDSEAGHTSDHDSEASVTDVPGGLMVSSGGYTLALRDPVLEAGRGRPVAFVIDGPDGPVTSYDVEHEKRLHFIAVRRDFSGFQHVHPELAPDGTWTTALDLTPGAWRVFADFKPSGADDLTLGSDLSVPGRVAAAEERSGARVSTVDGYTVTLEGDLVPGEASHVQLSVARAGQPVTDLQPYLGAYGHLVALRGGDLAYLHVHPEGEPDDGETLPGPDVEFVAEVPSAGSYHLYLDFKHDGVVRTAEFALDAGPGTGGGDGLHD
ncbi:MAG: hypothetical protein ABWX73_08615 [Marmoricola sp.]